MKERVVIPREALIKEGNNAYVIQVLPGNHYKLRNLTVAPHSESDTVSVVRGLKDGDEIVTTGAVLVYESIKRRIAKLRGRPDPGPADVARLLPVAYVVAALLVVMGGIVIIADIIKPLSLG